MRNFNQKRVLEVLGIPKPKSNCEHMELSYNQLEALRLLGLIDTNERQNESPTIQEFLDFCERFRCGEEEVIFECYLVTDREDSRLSVEGIQLMEALAGANTRATFINEFHHADEFSISNGLMRAWWD